MLTCCYHNRVPLQIHVDDQMYGQGCGLVTQQAEALLILKARQNMPKDRVRIGAAVCSTLEYKEL